MPDRTRGRAPEETCGTVSSGDVVALGMARIVSSRRAVRACEAAITAGGRGASARAEPARIERHVSRPGDGAYDRGAVVLAPLHRRGLDRPGVSTSLDRRGCPRKQV